MLAARASQGTRSSSQLGSLRQYRELTSIMAIDGFRMLHQADDFLVKTPVGNSDAKLESFLDLGRSLAYGACFL